MKTEARAREAFTYTEIMVALAILALAASAAFASLTQANKFAVSHRVYTCAQTLAQNQIDAFLSAGPFYPQLNPALIPPELIAGTATTAGITIYADSATNAAVVTGAMTRTVADLGLTQTTGGTTDPLHTRRLSVTLSYTFAGREYSVLMSTLRASDS